jgi:outer membrane protein TolC
MVGNPTACSRNSTVESKALTMTLFVVICVALCTRLAAEGGGPAPQFITAAVPAEGLRGKPSGPAASDATNDAVQSRVAPAVVREPLTVPGVPEIRYLPPVSAIPSTHVRTASAVSRVDETPYHAGPINLGEFSGVLAGPTSAIDLATALRLAERENPVIGLAREAIFENLALQDQARSLLLPTLVAGGNVRIHRGLLQQPSGQIIDLSSQSLYFGGGALAVGAGTVVVPAIRIFAPLGDAWLEPLVARQRLAASRATAQATFNTVLLDVTAAYLELAGAEARVETLRQASVDAAKIVQATSAFARVGQARQADANRALGRALLLHNEISRAEERVAVASAQLARILRLDPSTRLKPAAGSLQAVQLVDPSYRVEQLIPIALGFRPEMAARRANIAGGATRLRQEQVRPFLPTLSVGYSGGSFGGGSNLAPPTFDRFAGRSDFDVFAFWTLQNLGVGNLATQRSRRAELGQAIAEQGRTINQIRQEVADAYAASAARRRQIDVTARQVAVALNGMREELNRIQGGEGLPIEVLNSLELLVGAQQDSILAITEYDQAQFRLFVSLGEPPLVAVPAGQAAGLRPEGLPAN